MDMVMITHKYDKYECVYTDASKCEETNCVFRAAGLEKIPYLKY